MDIKYLEYVLEIAAQKSITHAAEALFVSQSALSQYLLKLEQELGTPLFWRTKNELLPTPAGELYISAAKSVVGIRRQLYHKISALEQMGRIRLGISSRWGIDMITQLLPEFRRNFPNVTLEIFQNKYRRLERMLMDEKLDIAVTATSNPITYTGDYRLLRHEEILFAVPASHHYCLNHENRNKKLTRAQWAEVFGQEDFICSESGSTLRKLEQDLFTELSMAPRIMCEVNDNMAALRMVENAMGVAFIPCDYPYSGGKAVCWQLEPGVYRSNILALRPHLKPDEAEKYLIDLITAYPIFCENIAI